MNYKLIAVNIDRTLLNNNNKITNKVKNVIKKYKDKNVKVILRTGKPLKEIQIFLNELNLNEEGDYVTTFNGTLIQDTYTEETIPHLTLNYENLCDYITK